MLYDPWSHARHCPDEVAPALVRYVPARQIEHVDDPAADWYAPAPHATHWLEFVAPDKGWYVPAMQFTHALTLDM